VKVFSSRSTVFGYEYWKQFRHRYLTVSINLHTWGLLSYFKCVYSHSSKWSTSFRSPWWRNCVNIPSLTLDIYSLLEPIHISIEHLYISVQRKVYSASIVFFCKLANLIQGIVFLKSISIVFAGWLFCSREGVS